MWWKRLCGESDEESGEYYGRKRMTVIIYDIVDNRSRTKLYKALQSYGIRVQKSAFECMLDDETHRKLVRKISKMINESTDLLRIYRMSRRCDMQCWGSMGHIENQDNDYWVV